MSKFNKAGTVERAAGPITSTDERVLTGNGAPASARDTKSELFLLAVSNMVGEATFYEGTGERDERFRSLVASVALVDPDWLTRFARWLRGEANMRSASLVLACEAVHARLAAGFAGGNRVLIDAVLQRPDEPGEMLAYWNTRFGRNVPMPVKRGIADATLRLYRQDSLVKYDTASKGYRFGDVIEVVHPSARTPEQGDLFSYAITRRHNRDDVVVPESLTLLKHRERLFAMPKNERRDLVIAAAVHGDNLAKQLLREAGMTWESLATWLDGPMDRAAWSAIIPSMGYMALLRNLRNFDEAGVDDQVAATVAARLSDPEQVARSRQLPMRFLSAYRAAPSLRWGHALETALGLSLANVPSLKGRTLILWDCSGSMNDRLSARSDLTRRDAAGVFAGALAMRGEYVDLVQFGTNARRVQVPKAGSVLRLIADAPDLGGTATARAVQQFLTGHDRVVIVTDEQYDGSGYFSYSYGGDPGAVMPQSTPLYTWNLAGYRGGGQTGTRTRWTFGGLTDQGFGMIPLIEAGQSGTWPF